MLLAFAGMTQFFYYFLCNQPKNSRVLVISDAMGALAPSEIRQQVPGKLLSTFLPSKVRHILLDFDVDFLQLLKKEVHNMKRFL